MEDKIRMEIIEKSGLNRSNESHSWMDIPKGTDFKTLLDVMDLHNISSAYWDYGADRILANKFYHRGSGEVLPGMYYLNRTDEQRRAESFASFCYRVSKEFE
tara:strand:+ start:500 stop:805 length:306 start_codon:yes stop_codon:yes gene_type:complete